MAYYSVNVFTADGFTTFWDFSFAGVSPGVNDGTTPYLYPADVKAVEMYRDEDNNPQVVERTVQINSPNRATIVGLPIAAGRQVKIFRQTEIRYPLVDYRDRQTVSELDLDLANRQAIFIAQETLDAASNQLNLDKFDNYNVNGHKIVNLQAGEDPNDAVNVTQLSYTLRSSDVPFAPLADAATRAGRLLAFDYLGVPTFAFPPAGTALELEMALAAPAGAGKVGMADIAYPAGSVGAQLRPLLYTLFSSASWTSIDRKDYIR